MLDALNAVVAPAAMERITLLFNHLLASEPSAAARLKPHVGRCIGLHFDRWPKPLPAPPEAVFRITPAGLLEWQPGASAAETDLRVTLDASNPAASALKWMSGDLPAMDIQGDAALAGDVHWLAGNLRWDVEADLERIVGPFAAHELVRFGSAVKSALQRALRTGGGLASRLRPGGFGRPAA